MTVAIYEKYKEWSAEYNTMTEVLKTRGFNHVKSFLFLSYFTLGFAFFKRAFYNETDSEKIIRILFDESLIIFAAATLALFLILLKISTHLTRLANIFSHLKIFANWVSNCSYEFIISLLFVYLVGIAIKAKVSLESIPWLNFTQPQTYISFCLATIFLIITLDLFLFVEKNKPKKFQAIGILLAVTALFALLTVISNIAS